MNSFGLGLVLSFTDRATSGMRSATATFQEMDRITNQLSDSSNASMFAIEALLASGAGLSVIGEQMVQTGTAITSVFAGLIQQTIDVGGTVQGFRMQLSALYGEVEGEEQLKRIQDFALTSVFQIEDLTRSVIMMKTVGIEALDEVTTSSGNATQALISYASDLAAMQPQMRNVYGTGVSAAMGAIREYIAEGNALSLKRGASLDITGLLGEETGATIEERTQQIADLIEKLGIVGYTKALEGTPTQRLSNMADFIFNTFSRFADEGVFPLYVEMLTKVTDWFFNLTTDTENYNNVITLLTNVMLKLLAPLNKLIDFLIGVGDALLELVRTNPKLVETLVTITAYAGVLLTVTGYVVKFTGSLFMLIASLALIHDTASRGITIFGMFKNSLALLTPIVTSIIAVAGLFYIAWSQNLLGFRDLVTSVFNELGILMSITFDAFQDNELSYEMWEKARDLGILPFVEAILQLKYHWDFFTAGFKSGFDFVFDTLNQFTATIEPITTSIFDLSQNVTNFIESFTGTEFIDDWEFFGVVLGNIAAVASIVIPVFFAITKAVTLLTTPLGMVIAAVTLLNLAWRSNFLGIRDVVESVVNWFTSLNWDGMFESAVTTFTLFYFEAVSVFTSVKDFILGIFSSVVSWVEIMWDGWLGELLTNLSSFVTNLADLLGLVVTFIYDRFISPLLVLAQVLITVLLPIVSSVFSGIVDLIMNAVDLVGSLINSLLLILSGVTEFLVGVFTGDWERAWNGIKNIVDGVLSGIGSLFSSIINGLITAFNVLIRGVNSITIPDWVPFVDGEVSLNLPEIPYLNTGGEIKGEGISYLHPNEVVVNSALTKTLGTFLEDYKSSKVTSSAPSQTPSLGSLVPTAPSTPQNPVASTSSGSSVSNDYSVHFMEGSVVIQLSNASDAELEKAAEKIMKIIERKQQLKQLATRK